MFICKLPSYSLKTKHNECDFGKWYASVESKFLTENHTFISLGLEHENLHKLANHVIDKYENNHLVYEEEYDLFVESEKVFFKNLNDLIENIITTKNQFDALTNIPNRGLSTVFLEKEYANFLRNKGSDYCIVFADIDHFKRVNDTYGHSVGDIVLQNTSKLFQKTIRPYDIVGRFGGEEFIFCFPKTNIVDTVKILERIKSELELLPMHNDKLNSVKITCSFGVVKMKCDTSLISSIKQADDALYKAKNNGRNRVEVWTNEFD